MGHGFGCGDKSCFDWNQQHVVIELSALCSLSYLRGVRICGGQRGLGSRFGACFQLAVRFCFFFVVRINRILMVLLGRTHVRSQVEFRGLCSSLTFGSSPTISGYDGALNPRIVDIFVLEQCYHICCCCCCRTERRSKRKGRLTNISFTVCPYLSHL